jgi:tetratricopeptide (TPR) repeat protein
MDLSTREGRREQGLLIQKAIERANLSAEELANRVGCSRALIYQYLSGTTLAQPDRLQQIASVTDVPLVFFFGAESAEPRRGKKGAASQDAQARLSERLSHLEELAAAQEGPADWESLASSCEQIVSLAAQARDVGMEARALNRLGRARIFLGEFTRAVASLARATQLFSETGDGRGEASARQSLGNALLATGRTDEAHEQFSWIAESPHTDMKWRGAVSLAAVDEQLGEFRKAMEHCDDAAALLEMSKDSTAAAVGMLYVNANRVNLYLACGDFNYAVPLAEKCLIEAETFGNSDQHLEARLNLGVCALYQGRWAESYRLLAAALPLARFLHDKSREAMCRAQLSILLAAMGDFDSAVEHAKEGLAAALSQGDHRAELFSQLGLADAYTATGRLSESRYHANQALAVASSLKLALYQAESRIRLAHVALQSGDSVEALDEAEGALQTVLKLGARHLEAWSLAIRAEVRYASGQMLEADADAKSASGLATELGVAAVVWEAESIRARIASSSQPPDLNAASRYLSIAVDGITDLRRSVTSAGLADTVLENKSRFAIFLQYARILIAGNQSDEALAFVRSANWPPLKAALDEGTR